MGFISKKIKEKFTIKKEEELKKKLAATEKELEELEDEEEVEEEVPKTEKELADKAFNATAKLPKKAAEKHEYMVVKELPVQKVRETISEDGVTTIHFITIEEALTEFMNK